MDGSPPGVAASTGTTLPHRPNGYIVSYGVSYTDVPTEAELPACPPSAKAVHAAFVSRCGFSPTFSPTLDNDVTKSRLMKDVRRAAMTMASHDVAVLFFSGHSRRMDDTACVFDTVGDVVSVRKLQAVFAKTVMERGLRDVAFIVILDGCQLLFEGQLLLPGARIVCTRRLHINVSGAGVADSDDRDDLNICVADAVECSWFVGFATSPSALWP